MMPQGASGGNSTIIVRDVLGYYFGLDKEKEDKKNDENDENTDIIEEENINLISNMKK